MEKLINMSFYNGTLNRDDLIDFVRSTDKPIKYTYGLAYRGPRTHNKPITIEEALEIIKEESLLDAKEYEDYLHLNAYSGNDMF